MMMVDPMLVRRKYIHEEGVFTMSRNSGILRKLLPRLHHMNILTEDLGTPNDLDHPEAKYMGLCCLGSDGMVRRIGMCPFAWQSF